MKKQTIWDNINIDLKDYYENFKKSIECNGWSDDPNDEDALWDYIHEELSVWLGGEKANLDIRTDGQIVCIAELGLWDGRKHGYRELSHNVNSIFDVMNDSNAFYFDGRDVMGIGHHHDGTNFYMFREVREGKDVNRLFEEILKGQKVSRQLLNHYTKSLAPYVKKVYGW